MLIRRAHPADARAIATVHVRSWKAAYPGLIPQSYLDRLRPEDRLAMWESTLEAAAWPRAGTFVVVDEDADDDPAPEAGDVIGFASIGPTRDPDADPATVGELQTLYVDPDHWGRGSGWLLMATAVEELRAGGYAVATLWVLDTNARAQRFYERLGWLPDGATQLHDWTEFVATDLRYRLHLG